jgi:hypothetical protein
VVARRGPPSRARIHRQAHERGLRSLHTSLGVALPRSRGGDSLRTLEHRAGTRVHGRARARDARLVSHVPGGRTLGASVQRRAWVSGRAARHREGAAGSRRARALRHRARDARPPVDGPRARGCARRTPPRVRVRAAEGRNALELAARCFGRGGEHGRAPRVRPRSLHATRVVRLRGRRARPARVPRRGGEASALHGRVRLLGGPDRHGGSCSAPSCARITAAT